MYPPPGRDAVQHPLEGWWAGLSVGKRESFELKQPALALKEFEASQIREPNRFRGHYGAARAAEAAGDRRKAADYYAKLMALAKSADTPRPEPARARA